jgi:hypothetical protein
LANIINGTDTGSGGLITTGDSSDELQIQTAETTAITVDSGQRTKFPTTIGVGDATPSASGSGISFPATQSASSDANTLDDYEEGTWTVTFTPSSSGSITLKPAVNLGSYTKVGRLVTITFGVTVDAVSSPIGLIEINLPLTLANLSERSSWGSVSIFVNASLSNVINYVALFEATSNRIAVYLGNSTGVSVTSANQIVANTEIFLTASYITA